MMRRLFALVVLFSALMHPALAETPLLQDGKSQLYQRILLRDDVPRRAQPDLNLDGPVARALLPFYVFEKSEDGDGPMLRVAVGQDGTGAFWVPEELTLPWNQSIVLTFTTLGGVERLLIFNTVDDVYDVVESEDPSVDAAILRDEALSALDRRETVEGPIISVGPELGVDLSSNFYMLPILEAEEAVFERGGFVNLLRVAIAKARSGQGAQGAGSGDRPTREEAVRDFRAGVVFVVDTTRSMGVFFDPVRLTVAAIYDELQAAGAEGQLAFGLVGFRDAMVKPAIEYTAKTFVDLPQGTNREAFLRGLTDMREARASTRGFNEDSFAGVLHSLENLNWEGLNARFVVVITDAGPRLGNDQLSTTRLGARQLANLAKDSYGAHIAVLHLKTRGGDHTHAMAEDNYTELSRAGQAAPLYFPVEGGSPNDLARKARIFTDAVSLAIREASAGREIGGGTRTPSNVTDDEDATIAERTIAVVQSLQLDYLGARTSETAPDVFEGWIADRDFQQTSLRPVEIRLLVTRNELSNLYESLDDIIKEGEDLEPQSFFQRLIAASAERVRAQGAVATGEDGRSIADAALIGELLDGLPYRSQVMSMDEDTWLGMGISEQQEFLDILYEKAERYRKTISTTDNWVRIHAEQTDDDAVYPMPLEDLP